MRTRRLPSKWRWGSSEYEPRTPELYPASGGGRPSSRAVAPHARRGQGSGMKATSNEGRAVLPVRPESIPGELKSRPQWVSWRREKRGEIWTKVPFDPKTGRRASITDLLTWGTFHEACVALETGGYDGLGF